MSRWPELFFLQTVLKSFASIHTNTYLPTINEVGDTMSTFLFVPVLIFVVNVSCFQYWECKEDG